MAHTAYEFESVASRPQSISIVLNNFNYGQFLAQAIDSALAQTRPVQVVVVDDGSTDDSRNVIEAYGSRVRAIFQANAGQGSAINSGFLAATGDIVMFLDADDMLDPTVAATLLDMWQPAAVMVQFPLHIVDAAGRRVGIYPDPPSSLSQGDVREELLRTGSFGANVTSGLAFRRDALAAVMPVPADELENAADGYLVRAVAFLGLVQRLDSALGSYRSHDANWSNLSATPGGLAQGFRKKISAARRELDFTRQLAAAHGLAVSKDFRPVSTDYIGCCLSLLLVDPASELVAGARRSDLLMRYVSAQWSSVASVKRRLLAIGLAVAATLSPAPLATRLLAWLHDPTTRPGWWRLRPRS